MRKHARFLYQPVIPLGKNKTFVTGCKAHLAATADIAAEGTVLLKNDGLLPITDLSKVALLGRGAGSGFLFGGGGSGSLHTTGRVNLVDGLKKCGIEVYQPAVDFYTAFVDKETDEKKAAGGDIYYHWLRGHDRPEPVLPQELYEGAKKFSRTCIYCLPRHSSEGSDYGDRSTEKGGFRLYDEEIAILDKICADFDKVIVILNVCGPIEVSYFKNNPKIGAVIYAMFGGHKAGQVLADIILGKRYPSGHLQDTLAESIWDYPTTKTFCESPDYVNYTEDIFVGYRYFETFAPEKVVYPFGFGLSYTTFKITKVTAGLEKNTVKLTYQVENTGSYKGKEVVQAYLTAPQGKLGKAKKVLCAFGKTKELLPGEKAMMNLSFDIREFGSFDDLGKIKESAFILEKGEYTVSVGNNVRATEEACTFTLDSDIICRQCHAYLAPNKLEERLTANGSYEKLPKAEIVKHKPKGYKTKQPPLEKEISLVKALDEGKLDAFIAKLNDSDLVEMLYGHPDFNAADTNGIGLMRKEKWDEKKVPLVPTADGPAGLRIFPDSGIFPTHLPCANLVAQSWNLKLAEKIGTIGALEVKENNAGIWLSPALNIHRSPLCGRNFEYYSEDPLIAGLFAAHNVKGVQAQKIAATVKHYLANNKEVNRKNSDTRASQRALREIYLRAFEIVVKKAKPWALMTSYNLINGVQASANWESINGVLRGEWGYDGVVMTDWWAFSHIEDELNAGSDVKMPAQISYKWGIVDPNYNWVGAPQPYDLANSLHDGKLDRTTAQAAVKRILTMMGKFE